MVAQAIPRNSSPGFNHETFQSLHFKCKIEVLWEEIVCLAALSSGCAGSLALVGGRICPPQGVRGCDLPPEQCLQGLKKFPTPSWKSGPCWVPVHGVGLGQPPRAQQHPGGLLSPEPGREGREGVLGTQSCFPRADSENPGGARLG